MMVPRLVSRAGAGVSVSCTRGFLVSLTGDGVLGSRAGCGRCPALGSAAVSVSRAVDGVPVSCADVGDVRVSPAGGLCPAPVMMSRCPAPVLVSWCPAPVLVSPFPVVLSRCPAPGMLSGRPAPVMVSRCPAPVLVSSRCPAPVLVSRAGVGVSVPRTGGGFSVSRTGDDVPVSCASGGFWVFASVMVSQCPVPDCVPRRSWCPALVLVSLRPAAVLVSWRLA